MPECAGAPDAPVFPTRSGRPLSRDALAQRVATHVATAARACPSLRNKTVTPHALRHTAAMRLLHAGVDNTVIALWLGHENVRTTDIYIHADLALKERALARTTPTPVRAGRYRPPDKLLATDFGGSGTAIPGSGTRISGSGTAIPGEVERGFRGRERSSVA